MIARVWCGRTLEDKADAYVDYLLKTGIKDHGAIDGNRGDYIWKRVDNGIAEIWVISLWDSLESIREFAGPQEDEAVYYPEDKEYLLELEPRVMHYEIVHAPAH
jgi:heme-degrading monooxygenase HmoA